MLTFQKLNCSLGLLGFLTLFHRFAIVDTSMKATVCLLFYLVIKMWEVLTNVLNKKIYQTWLAAVKTFKIHQDTPTRSH